MKFILSNVRVLSRPTPTVLSDRCRTLHMRSCASGSAPDIDYGSKPSSGETAEEEDWTDISGVVSIYSWSLIMKDFLEGLSKSAWETSCARYNASRRLKIREIFSTISIALIGLSGIALSLIQSSFGDDLGNSFNNLVTAFSIILSMLLIIISLIEWGFAAGAKSEALFRNAELLNEHERKIKLYIGKVENDKSSDSFDQADMLRDEYEKIKSTCTFNHSPLDYEYHKIVRQRFYIANTTENFGLIRNIKGRFSYIISSIWGYLFVWVLVVSFFCKVIDKII